MPSGNPGIKHAPDCTHCKAVATGPKFDRAGWVRDYGRRRRLADRGLTEDTFESLLADQGGGCAICGGPPGNRWNRFPIDHDHKTGEVRGLLCTTCNTHLGWFERNAPAIMEYL